MRVSLINVERLTGLSIKAQQECLTLDCFMTGDLRDLNSASIEVLVSAGGDVAIYGLEPADEVSDTAMKLYHAKRMAAFFAKRDEDQPAEEKAAQKEEAAVSGPSS